MAATNDAVTAKQPGVAVIHASAEHLYNIDPSERIAAGLKVDLSPDQVAMLRALKLEQNETLMVAQATRLLEERIMDETLRLGGSFAVVETEGVRGRSDMKVLMHYGKIYGGYAHFDVYA
ncbi:MAG: hypothetical protein QS98_C0013G0014 [archaeon GW2011_AR3]|nr:MAG: hypothetical protein QS98_C0013G0014 [archaeon GW2011_AR3]MBS3108959.1 hypothetical protein [Candidatus Woesearchaeota archaeon]